MTAAELLVALFPAGHAVRDDAGVLVGPARAGAGEVAVVGTADGLEVGVEAALALAAEVLRIVREHPGRPIVVLVHSRGQRMSRRDEILGLNGYLGHLAACVELARRGGHRLVAVVYGDAVSGGVLPLGFMADEVHAVEGANPWVMSLARHGARDEDPGRAPRGAVANSSALLSPGLEPFVRLGAVEPPWTPPLAAALDEALSRPARPDRRAEEGLARGGRLLAARVAARVAGAGAAPGDDASARGSRWPLSSASRATSSSGSARAGPARCAPRWTLRCARRSRPGSPAAARGRRTRRAAGARRRGARDRAAGPREAAA